MFDRTTRQAEPFALTQAVAMAGHDDDVAITRLTVG